MSVMLLVVGAYVVLQAVAAGIDVMRLEVPNTIPLALVALFIIVAGHSPASVAWISHLAAGGLVLAAGMALFAWGRLGGGDAKLMAACALWQGMSGLAGFLLFVALAGLALTGILLSLRAAGLGRRLSANGIVVASLDNGAGLPYAVAIAAGGIAMAHYLPIMH